MLRAFVTIGALQALTMLVLLVRTKGLALLLGPAWLGVMSVIDRLLAVFAQTAALSLPFAALRFLPGKWESGTGHFLALFGRMRNVLVGMLVIAAGIGLTLTFLVPSVFGKELSAYRPVLLIAFLSIPVLSLAPFAQNVIAARFQHNRAMVFAFGHAVVFTAAALVGVSIGGLSGLYALYAASGLLLVMVVLRGIGRGAVPTTNEGRLGPLGLPRQVWRFSMALMLLTFAAPYAALFVIYQVLAHDGPRAVHNVERQQELLGRSIISAN